MTQFKFVYHADEHERFAPGSFDGAVGGEVSFRQEGVRLRNAWFEDAWLAQIPQSGTARIVAAEVAQDGRSVQFTAEFDEPSTSP